ESVLRKSRAARTLNIQIQPRAAHQKFAKGDERVGMEWPIKNTRPEMIAINIRGRARQGTILRARVRLQLEPRQKVDAHAAEKSIHVRVAAPAVVELIFRQRGRQPSAVAPAA